jgi:hypothetical protein
VAALLDARLDRLLDSFFAPPRKGIICISGFDCSSALIGRGENPPKNSPIQFLPNEPSGFFQSGPRKTQQSPAVFRPNSCTLDADFRRMFGLLNPVKPRFNPIETQLIRRKRGAQKAKTDSPIFVPLAWSQ